MQKIKLDSKFCNELQKAMIESNAFKDAINTMINMHRFDETDEFIDSAVFKKYNSQYVEAFSRYELLKDMLTDDYIPDDVKARKSYSWAVNFNSQELEITEAN